MPLKILRMNTANTIRMGTFGVHAGQKHFHALGDHLRDGPFWVVLKELRGTKGSLERTAVDHRINLPGVRHFFRPGTRWAKGGRLCGAENNLYQEEYHDCEV